MTLTDREIWTAAHGMVLGAGFLLLFSGTLVGLWILRPNWLTPSGARVVARLSAAAAWGMALLAFAAVLAGTYVIYPWYRAKPPPNATPDALGEASPSLSHYPKFLLLSRPETSGWHEFGMEWKEHVAWLAPILATAVAYCLTRLGAGLVDHPRVRRALLVILTISFFCAAVAGALGALINKAAPTK
ncbi:MAG: hypothetical protein ABSB42_03580 [Tepidisphaeraceae bacterium]|jgi:hypothetical protein